MHAAFADHWLVKGLGPKGCEQIYALGDVMHVDPDQVLIEADVPNDAMFVRLEGAFKVAVPWRPDRVGRGTLAHRGPGDLLGEYSFIDAQRPSARVTASTAGRVLRIPHEGLRQLLQRDGVISTVLYRNLLHYRVDRLRSQDDELDCLML